MAGEKRLPDGRLFFSWEDEQPDPAQPCPVCGQAWEDHAGEVERAALDGHAGYVIPRCPGSVSRAEDDA